MSVDVEQLVSDHKTAVTTDEGIVFHTVPSLLGQLRDAVYAGMGADGARVGFGSKLPIQAAALDLYMLIDRQITEAWVGAFKRVPNADRIEALLSEWAAWADDETVVNPSSRVWVYAPSAVASWVKMIEDYLNPPRLAEIDHACIACGERWVYRQVDGETVRSSALSFRRDRATGETIDARCEACGAIWPRSQFEWLADALGIPRKETA